MSYVLPFSAISAADLPRVGGKGANLGELSRAGFPVPPGFCVTTAGFDLFMKGAAIDFADLDALDGRAAEKARVAAEGVRAALEEVPFPEEVAAEVTLDAEVAYAVRSSATAEDLPDASFAGQQDTYLNVRGREAMIAAIRRCWISLFTDRAVLYRARNHFDHRAVKLAVVVQHMVRPDVSGILFTTDPVSGRRKTVSIEASYGLGEALVSGLVNADLYRVDKETHEEMEVSIGDKAVAIRPLPGGGTRQEDVPAAQRKSRVLDPSSLQGLVALGVNVEAHYGKPQDIEWCIEAGRLFIVQARPITTLYPVPQPSQDGARIYLSFGHVQMMTNVMPPLSVEVWQLLLPMQRREGHSLAVTSAGSRIFLDFTPLLRHPLLRRGLMKLMEQVYPAIADGLRLLTTRPSFVRDAGPGRARLGNVLAFARRILKTTIGLLLGGDPESARRRAERLLEEGVARARARLQAAAQGIPRLREAEAVLRACFSEAFLRLAAPVPSGFIAMRLVRAWCGDGDDVDALERGLPGNVTTEMDLCLGDLIEMARKEPGTRPPSLPAWRTFMERFGMRGPGEVDISRPRYKDDPQMIGATLETGRASHASARGKHEALAGEAGRATDRLLARARHGLFGSLRMRVLRHLIAVARNGMALREHPKFYLVRVLDLVRDIVRDAGKTLGVGDDVFFFRFDELRTALAGGPTPDVAARKEALSRDAHRAPPLMMASDGEIPILAPRDGLPQGALPGTAASAGVVEGIAHVIHDPSAESLAEGEILVAPHTDPGWTPLFVHAAGVVTEVGGLITHGSVVAREYGIPAVVSVASATARIRTGQRIRVDGTRGFVEILDNAQPQR